MGIKSATRAGVVVGLAILPLSLFAVEPQVLRVRVSVKRILSDESQHPTGVYGPTEAIMQAIAGSNAALDRSHANVELVLTEIRDVVGAPEFYVMSAHEAGSLEAAAQREPDTFSWRDDAINIYVVDRLTDAGGVCSFPTFGPHRNVIVINSLNILGGAEGWLHEVGHYFNLIHTHDGDRVPDTLPDTPPPRGNCRAHDRNFVDFATGSGASEFDILYLLHNVMSYHCNPLVLTPLQVIRMRRAAFDHRSDVLEAVPADAAPVADITVTDVTDSPRVELRDGQATVSLDGRYSHDGDGGTVISFGGDSRARHPTHYFRKAFAVDDPAGAGTLKALLLRDDGAVVYLNGREVLRSNMPAGPILFETLASSPTAGEDELKFVEETLADPVLNRGENVLAVEVHQVSGDSSDLSFALELIDEQGNLLVPRVSAWRYHDGGEDLGDSWKEASFDDSSWDVGAAPLGYGDIDKTSDQLLWRWSVVDGPPGGAVLDPPPVGWALGRTGIGYGDSDDITVLEDMRGNYLTVYLVRPFRLEALSDFRTLEFDVTYDDGFAAYLNGAEIARRNLSREAHPSTPAFESREPTREVIDLTQHLSLLRSGRNLLAVEVHNSTIDNQDLTIHPILYGRLAEEGARVRVIPSRSLWYYRKGLHGEPPPDWTDIDFDPGGSRTRLTVTVPGTYRVRLEVDDGTDPFRTHTDEAEIRVPAMATRFLRGDCDRNDTLGLSDALTTLAHLFEGTQSVTCADACDTNDDETTGLDDVFHLLNFLFLGGEPPPAPFPEPGVDPAGDGLSCETKV